MLLFYYIQLIVLIASIILLFLLQVSYQTIIIFAAIGYIAINYSFITTFFQKLLVLIQKDILLYFAWVLLFISIFLWRGRSSAELITNPVDEVAFLRMAEVSMACILSLFMFRVSAVSHILTGLLPFMFIYSILALISSLYSSFQLYTLWKAFETSVGVLLIAVTLSRIGDFEDMKAVSDLILGLFGFLLIMIWVGAAIEPSRAFLKKGFLGFMLAGVFPIINPNAVGFIGALLGIVAFCRMFNVKTTKDRIFYQNIFFVSLVTLILAQARTSLAGFLLAALFWLALNKKIRWLTFLVLLGGIVALNSGLSDYIIAYFKRGQSEEVFTTLSGRTIAWAHAWNMFKKSPIIGYGFASGARFDVLKGLGMVGLHGSLFDVLVNLGILGLVPWLMAVIGTWVYLLRIFFRYGNQMRPDIKAYHTEIIAIMTILTLRAVTGTAIVMHDKEFILFLLILAYAQYSMRTKGFTTGR